jgi:hypothetical protein
MDPDSGRPQFLALYLILPIITASAFADPASDAVLETFGAEPNGVAKLLATATVGVVIGVAIFLILIFIRRFGKN